MTHTVIDPRLLRRWTARIGAAALALGGPVLMFGYLPRTTGVSWSSVLAAMSGIAPGWLIALGLVWLAGLLAHSLVLTSSLPGLTPRRAVSLNLAGSAVANSIPMGGAISVGLTGAMARSWGFAPVALAGYLTVSSIWNILVRLLAGLGALTWLAATHSAAIWASSMWVLAVAGAILLAASAALARERTSARLGAIAGSAVDYVTHRPGCVRRRSWAMTFIRVRRQTLRLIARSWPRLSVGMVGYLALLVVLLDLCLRAIGSPQSIALVAAAVGVERLVSAVPLTPGGAGVAELGMVACLTVCGVSPLSAVAATVLYRVFTFFVEIPVGLAVTAGWGLSRRRHAVMAATR